MTNAADTPLKREHTEAALETDEQNFAAIIDALPLLCFMAQTDGYVSWYNKGWLDYTGFTLAELQGWGWERAHDPAILPEVTKRWNSSIETGQPFEMIFPLRGRDGIFRPFLTRVQPVRAEDGAIMRWLGTNTDISAQQEAEVALKRLNETLESRVVAAIAEREAAFTHLAEIQKLETVGQLTGGVAHDFNNLLTPILGNLDMLRRRFQDDDRAQRLIGGAMQGAERARTLVQRLLAFARRQVLESRPVNVPQLVRGIEELISRTMGPQIVIKVDAPETCISARIDPSQLELALLNLAVNSRDAMAGGGTLTIGIDEQTVGPDDSIDLRHGTYVRLMVTDTGVGMDAVTLKSAVEPFYSTKGIGQGTGLGLSMVHGLAAQSGGALFLASAPGEGTRAEIWIPSAGEIAAPTRDMDTPPISNGRSATILLVDDEDLVRIGTAELLKDLGHVIVEATSAAHAIDLLRNGATPDLLITDYLMPGMRGTDLAVEVGRLQPDLPILLLTGYANLAGHQLADLPLLPKPFRQAELAARIADLLDKRAKGGGNRREPRTAE